MITSAGMYNLLGLAAPQWRRVDLQGKRALAVQALRNWHALDGEHPGVVRSRAADLLLLFRGNRKRHRRRLNPIPGQPAVIRYDLRAAMGYDGSGRLDGGWGLKVDGADKLNEADVPMLKRIARLPDSKIRRAVQIGDLPVAEAAELYGTLIARREVLRARLQELTGG